jgi:hypothetical protein
MLLEFIVFLQLLQKHNHLIYVHAHSYKHMIHTGDSIQYW